jgi:hypothetical protein
VLVVVHPHLEHLAPHADLRAELLHQRLLLLLHPPSEPLRERQHPRLLLRRELGPEPLPVLPLLRGGRRPPLVAGGVGGGGAAAAAGRAVVRERVAGVGEVGRRHDARGRRRRHRRGREQQLAGVVVLAVEAAVAPAGGALERVVRAGHELPAPVDDVAAQRRRVVAQALVVPHLGVRERRRRGPGAHLMVDGPLLLAARSKFHMPGCRRAQPGGKGGCFACLPKLGVFVFFCASLSLCLCGVCVWW